MVIIIPYLLAKNALLMGFARFVGCRIRPSIVMLTPIGPRKPGHNRATWPVPTGRAPSLRLPLLDYWALGPWSRSIVTRHPRQPAKDRDNQQIGPECRNPQKLAKIQSTRKHGVEFPKRRVRDQKVDTVFICPFGGIFPINGSS